MLESIRDLMNEDTVIPPWLHDIFLGYGDPAAATYSSMGDACLRVVDCKDTFLDVQHVRDCFPQYQVRRGGRLALRQYFFPQYQVRRGGGGAWHTDKRWAGQRGGVEASGREGPAVSNIREDSFRVSPALPPALHSAVVMHLVLALPCPPFCCVWVVVHSLGCRSCHTPSLQAQQGLLCPAFTSHLHMTCAPRS